MASESAKPYVLGLDIGASSIGWALIGTSNRKPQGLIRCGARVFDAGMEEGDFSAGKENSRSAARRQARQARKLINRRLRRQRKLFNLLVKAGFLPAGDPAQVLPQFDAALRKKHIAPLPKGSRERRQWEHALPYHLRAMGLAHRLEPLEFGRAIYHLGQRRGFLSNRKAPPRKDEKPGEVKAHITELEKKMQDAGAQTVGQYLAALDPEEERIRRRWTSRQMYLDEFKKIWVAQAAHHRTILTEDLCKRVYRAIFHQRPLKSQKGLIGTCEFERGRQRAPWGLILAQRFRMLQQVGNARIVAPNGAARNLTSAERGTLLAVLDRQGELSFGKARALLKLPRGHAFNWESGGEDRFIGNKTHARLAQVFGERWWSFTDSERDQVVEDVLSIQKDETLSRRGQRRWGLDPEAAARFGQLALEDGHCGLSRQALAKLVPLLERGLPYSTAVKEVYGERRKEPVDFLPPPAPTYPHLRNPMVLRVLAELRKVVNAIVRQHGKPAAIRVELARDMRRSKKQRKESWQRMRQNERDRREAAAKIAAEAGIQDPGRADVEKVLLANECNWVCPYTGKSISMNSLLGPNPEFDVEHIIPFSRSLDDSFTNKTLCEIKENRDHKGNRTPHEAYAGQPDKWLEILARVRRFRGSAAEGKLRRFQQETVEGMDDFASRQLNDTRYAARQATDYLALLYGGPYEIGGRRRIQASRGSVTAYLRSEWQLNTILGDGGAKSRDDHRHHAVDAVAIALTDASTIKMLSDAAERAAIKGTRWWRERIDDPWSGFLDDVRQAIEGLNVSHRVSRKVNGPLHEETNYGPSKARDPSGRPVSFTVRKHLEDLSLPDVKLIADERVRQLVTAKLEELGGDPNKAFGRPENHPCFVLKDGRRVPIHAVRIRSRQSAMPVGQGARLRYVASGSNHHMEVFEVKDAKGKTRWKGRVVSRYEAIRRLAKRQPVVDRTAPEGGRFLFSLATHEIMSLTDANGAVNLYRVRKVSQSKSGSIEIAGARLNDARLKDDIIKAGDWLRIRSVDDLARKTCCKVLVTPLGEVRDAND
jgi:CRISPR-associated endonuclease Csn1